MRAMGTDENGFFFRFGSVGKKQKKGRRHVGKVPCAAVSKHEKKRKKDVTGGILSCVTGRFRSGRTRMRDRASDVYTCSGREGGARDHHGIHRSYVNGVSRSRGWVSTWRMRWTRSEGRSIGMGSNQDDPDGCRVSRVENETKRG